MDAKGLEGTRSNFKDKVITKDDCIVEEEVEGEIEEQEGLIGTAGGGGGGVSFVTDEKKKGVGGMYGKRGTSGGGGASSPPSCQVEKCGADLSEAKRYHRRHKVCEVHAKSAAVIVSGLRQRFCQQCSRFHELSEFDETKRSCRRRLAGHNERRRKSSGESYGEAGGSRDKGVNGGCQLKQSQRRQVDESGRFQTNIPAGNSTYKRSQIS